jgi:hypothetical protein
MEKLTREQIVAVDKALWDIGINFLDIRIEMTDHAATAIEDMEGGFDMRLKKYISVNKKELIKNYSQFRVNASIKAIKLLFSNMLSFRFLGILASVFVLVFAEYKYEGLEETSSWVLILSVISIPLLWIFIGYINFTKSTRLFSTAERLFPTISGVAYLMCIPLRSIIDKLEISDAAKLLYYAFVISFYIIIGLTYRFLTKFYKLKYQVV